MDFYSKVLEHANENPETARTTNDAVVNALFPGAKFGVPKNEKVENTLGYMLGYTDYDMMKLAKILTRIEEPDFRCERTTIAKTGDGYLLRVYHYDFPGPFMGGLGLAGYFNDHHTGIVLNPGFGQKTKLLLEALDELNGKNLMPVDQFEAASLVSEYLHHITDTYEMERIISQAQYYLSELRFQRGW